MKAQKEIIIGVIISLTIFGSIWGINFLKGNDVFTKELTFDVLYERVDGLVETSPVFLNGLKIGQVKQIYLAPDSSGNIVVKVMLFNKDLAVPKNSTFKLTSSSIFEPKSLQLILGEITPQTTYLHTGDRIEGLYDTSIMERIDPLEKKVDAVIENINKILEGINSILDPQVQQSLKNTVVNLDKTVEGFEKTSQTIDGTMTDASARLKKILANVESITNTLDQNKDKITTTLSNLSSVSDSLKAANLKSTINNANLAIAELHKTLEQINSGNGSLGKLVNDEKLYNNLNNLTVQLDTLLKDVQSHPSRYVRINVFGGKNKEGHKVKLKEKK